jgi:methylenetetrahydrofolate reductase (NADPH)
MASAAELAELLRGYSVEVTPRSRSAIEVCRDHLAPGTEVYIAFVPGEILDAVVATAAALQAAGFVPVPHVTARNVASFTQLEDFLGRLAGEAGVTRTLVIGGDLDRPAGPYHSSLELLRTGLFQQHGIRRIGLACYPEAHPRIGADLLEQALLAKLEVARAAGLEPWLVSQFCFEAAPILSLLERLRALGIRAPVRVGLAGPAERRTLLKYALHCGIGNTIRALGRRTDTVSNLLVRRAPDDLVRALAAARRLDPSLGIEGIHLFTFGGLASAALWANALLAAAEVPEERRGAPDASQRPGDDRRSDRGLRPLRP